MLSIKYILLFSIFTPFLGIVSTKLVSCASSEPNYYGLDKLFPSDYDRTYDIDVSDLDIYNGNYYHLMDHNFTNLSELSKYDNEIKDLLVDRINNVKNFRENGWEITNVDLFKSAIDIDYSQSTYQFSPGLDESFYSDGWIEFGVEITKSFTLFNQNSELNGLSYNPEYFGNSFKLKLVDSKFTENDIDKIQESMQNITSYLTDEQKQRIWKQIELNIKGIFSDKKIYKNFSAWLAAYFLEFYGDYISSINTTFNAEIGYSVDTISYRDRDHPGCNTACSTLHLEFDVDSQLYDENLNINLDVLNDLINSDKWNFKINNWGERITWDSDKWITIENPILDIVKENNQQ